MYGNKNDINRGDINYFNPISNGKSFEEEWILIKKLFN
jgi:hypothetical protein